MGELPADRRLEILERQVKTLRQDVRTLEEWVDTLASPWWKKLWWLVCGWRWYRVGRWYR